MPLPLSVAIVCRSNEATIGRTLDSVAGLASEIVAVDSGSTDGTIPLLQRHGARVVPSAWLGHVRTKQLALESTREAWILCLDSDESLEPALRRSVQEALAAPGDVDGFWVNRKVWYRGRPLEHAWQPEWRLRLVRRGAAAWGGFDPHDALQLQAGRASARLAGDLRHDSFATFEQQLRKQVEYARLTATAMAAAGRRGSYVRLLTSPAGAFFKQLVLKQAFLDGWPGWLAAAATASQALTKHALLIEHTRSADASKPSQD